MDVAPFEAFLGLLALYVVPGFGVTAAVFPEKIRPFRDRRRIAVEVGTMTVLLSVSATIVLGEILQTVGPGFSASWGDPRLPLLDLGLGAAGLVIAGARGAFRRPSEGPGELPTSPPGEPAWETLRELERLAREERRLAHRLRARDLTDPERSELESSRSELVRRRDALRADREAEFAA